jgi:protein disulfide-isomerase
LIELGKEIGLTEIEVNEALTNSLYVQKVESDSEEAQTLGASGVPFFAIDRKYAIAGAQQPNEILNTLEKAFAEWKKNNHGLLQVNQGATCTPGNDCTH